jgi:hypothetical protein
MHAIDERHGGTARSPKDGNLVAPSVLAVSNLLGGLLGNQADRKALANFLKTSVISSIILQIRMHNAFFRAQPRT